MAELHPAAREGDTSAIILAIGRGSDVNLRDKLNRTPLHLAAWAGQLDAVKLLLSQEGCNSTAAAMDDMNALHFGAQKGHTEVLRALLNAGLHVNSRTRKGMTALHFAAQNGHLETVKFLLSRKANIHATTCKQQTALKLAKHQDIQAVLESAAKEVAEQLAAAAQERPDGEARRQRNAGRRRGKQGGQVGTGAEGAGRAAIVMEEAADADALDSRAVIGPPGPPAGFNRKAEVRTGEAGEESIGAPGPPSGFKHKAAAPETEVNEEAPATMAYMGPAAPPAGFKRKAAAVEPEGDEEVPATGGYIQPAGAPTAFKRKAEAAVERALGSGEVIGAAGPPPGFIRKIDAGVGKRTVGMVVVPSFMDDDEDED